MQIITPECFQDNTAESLLNNDLMNKNNKFQNFSLLFLVLFDIYDFRNELSI